MGGDLRASTVASLDGRPLLIEDLDLGCAPRAGLAVMGAARCLDSVTVLGARTRSDRPGVLQLDGAGSIDRRLLDSLHGSDLDARCHDAIASSRPCAL